MGWEGVAKSVYAAKGDVVRQKVWGNVWERCGRGRGTEAGKDPMGNACDMRGKVRMGAALFTGS